MSEKTGMFLIATVLSTAFALIMANSFAADPVLAVKTSTSHKSKGTSSTGSSSTSSGSTSSSGKLKSLVSCVTTSAKAAGAGGLSQNQVLNCYSQAYGNATGVTNSTGSPLTTGNSTSGGAGSSGGSSTSSSSSHHHKSGTSTK